MAVVVELSARLTMCSITRWLWLRTFCRKRVLTRRSQPNVVLMDSNVKESVILKLTEMGIVELTHGYNPSVVTFICGVFRFGGQRPWAGWEPVGSQPTPPVRTTSMSFSRYLRLELWTRKIHLYKRFRLGVTRLRPVCHNPSCMDYGPGSIGQNTQTSGRPQRRNGVRFGG